eukprot:267449-Chlamydomonas_euryale.AAC.2
MFLVRAGFDGQGRRGVVAGALSAVGMGGKTATEEGRPGRDFVAAPSHPRHDRSASAQLARRARRSQVAPRAGGKWQAARLGADQQVRPGHATRRLQAEA